MGWELGSWNWGSAPGWSRDPQAAPGLGSFWEPWKGIGSRDIPAPFLAAPGLPGPSCTAEIRLALQVWDFSRDCGDGPGAPPDVFSRDAKLGLSGFPCFPWMAFPGQLIPVPLPCTSAGQGPQAPLARIWDGGSWCSACSGAMGASQSCHHPGREKLAAQESWKWLQKEGEQMDLGLDFFFFPALRGAACRFLGFLL